ncbi:MAG: 3-deoxy-D-manno-octulosonic acid kinase [Aestuariibacter sp.]
MNSAPLQRFNNQLIWHDDSLLPDCNPHFFDGMWWQTQGLLTGESKGRGTTYFFRYQHNEFVLRHYLRGGLIGRLLTDQYFFTGLENTRAWQEKNLLMHMNEAGLSTPVPAAARIQKMGLYYRADLITIRIPHARDIHHILMESALSDDVWHKIGKTIAHFHTYQIYHHDLNIHNIMLDESGKVWLIDFDKGCVKKGDDWKQQNLDRLHRSLEKELTLHEGYQYSHAGWQKLLEGYYASHA